MSDSQGVELVQPEVAEPRLPVELTKTPSKTPKKTNKKIKVVEPVPSKVPLQPQELTKTPNKINRSAELIQPEDFIQSKVAEPFQPTELTQKTIPKKIAKCAGPVYFKVVEPLQSNFTKDVQSKVEEPLQPIELTQNDSPKKISKHAEPVQLKVVEPVVPTILEPVQSENAAHVQSEIVDTVQSNVTEPVQSKVAEPVQSKVIQPVQPVPSAVGEPVQSGIKEPLHSEIGEPVQSGVGEPVHSKVGEPIQSEFGEPVQSGIKEPLLSEIGEPVKSEVGKPVQSEVGEPVQSGIKEPLQSEAGEPVKSEVGELVQSEVGEPVQPDIGEPVPPSISKPKEVTKFSIRRTVWDQLYRSKLVLYPLPFGRIPNFIGAEQASAKLLDLEIFQKAKSVQVNPDKSLESARLLVLNNEKNLYVPCPGLNRSLMLKLEPDEEHDIKNIVTRWGIDNLGKRIHMKDEVSIDLMVTGSVAVSENGYRIGKGQGYTDMEFAILKDRKAIDNNTVIVTIVHDSQVMDLPKDIFEKYDVPVDYILTPTRIIKVNHNIPKPEGILWTEFTQRQLKSRKFFKELKLIHESEGRDTTLKVETPEDRYLKIPHRKWPQPYRKRKPRPRPVEDETVTRNKKPAVRPKKVIPPRSTPVKNASSTSIGAEEPSEDTENIPPPKKTKKKKKKPQIVYSLKVSNIEKTVRLRDLKMALIERGIKPNKIAWKGSRGYCYLNYAKKKPKKEGEGEGDGADEESDAINSVIEMIQELKIHSEKCFIVKVMEPITRIETVEVTAV